MRNTNAPNGAQKPACWPHLLLDVHHINSLQRYTDIYSFALSPLKDTLHRFVNFPEKECTPVCLEQKKKKIGEFILSCDFRKKKKKKKNGLQTQNLTRNKVESDMC